MRARLALHISDIKYYIYEISLKDKPEHMISISPKGTVPVLLIDESIKMDESLEIMLWAFQQAQIKDKLIPKKNRKEIFELIQINDSFFKKNLDLYKYAQSDIDKNKAFNQCMTFIKTLDNVIEKNNGFILSKTLSFADYAIFPFIRQFVNVDQNKFKDTNQKNIEGWYSIIHESSEFKYIMKKPNLS
jgi:glutathione S-transferase